MLKKLWAPETWFFLALWLGLLCFGQRQFLFDPGAFWNTVIGQRIVASQDVPRAEEFSYTFDGTPWQSHQWLAQVVMAGVHGIGGLDSLVLAAAALLAATYAWAVGRLIRSGCHWMVVAFLLALLLLGSRYHWLVRPQLATIALFGWTFAQLLDFEAGRVSWRRLCWLPAAFVLWTNLHGGALGGLCTLAIVLAGWCGAWLIGWPSPLKNAADLGRVLLLGAACVLATLVNPYGWDLPLGWIRLMDLKMLPRYIVEHMPLDWENPYQRGIVVLGLVYAFVFATVPFRQWRVTWLVPIIWFLLTIQRVRHCTLFSIAAVLAMADVLPHTRLAVWTKSLGFPLTTPPESKPTVDAPAAAWILPGAAVAISLLLQAFAVPVPLIGAGHARTDPALMPIELLGPIRERSKPNDPIFNELAFGGFLIYYAPELRITIDDRCELYGDEFIGKLAEMSIFFDRLRREGKDPSPHDELDRWADAEGIRLALVAKGQGLDFYLESVPDRWTRVAETGPSDVSPASLAGAALYERKR